MRRNALVLVALCFALPFVSISALSGPRSGLTTRNPSNTRTGKYMLHPSSGTTGAE